MQTAYFNCFELEIPDFAVPDCSHSGPCDADIAFWMPYVTFPAPDLIRSELAEYGAWDAEELADDEQNKHRLLWIAAGNIREEERAGTA